MKIRLCAFFFVLLGCSKAPPVSSPKGSSVTKIAATKRIDILQNLSQKSYDLLVIGGGATGAGVALDAASRGLKVALVEKNDYGSGTSGRSTKLVHGGVRYLEKAFMNLDYGQYKLVKEALYERKLLGENAPHLVHPLEIVTPVYTYWESPYYWFGLKVYDFLSGSQNLAPSRWASKADVHQMLPNVKTKGLKGGVVYFDGQFQDTRLNVTLLLSAQSFGADIVNHVEVAELHKDQGKLAGALLRDTLNGNEIKIKARTVVNATGPFSDAIRFLDNSESEARMVPSLGTHLLLDKKWIGSKSGMLIPKTPDGRIVFMLPWQGKTLVGTTDEPSEVTFNPMPGTNDVAYLLELMNGYLEEDATPADVLSIWTGQRPLVRELKAKSTQAVSRHHVIEVSESGMVSIMGGKWTTYRKMAEDTVDKVYEVLGQSTVASKTPNLKLLGADGYNDAFVKDFVETCGYEKDIGTHLAETYGVLAPEILKISDGSLNKRLVTSLPYLESEVIWAVKNEHAVTPQDILLRRVPVAVMDAKAALGVLGRTADLMAQELAWSSEDKKVKVEKALNAIDKFVP